jgi:hypothetical protein
VEEEAHITREVVMKSALSISAIAGAIFLVAGCGPVGPKPMAERLSDDDQKALDESWNKALAPVDKLDRQALLDVLVYTQAYQVGVDRLTFRSEKTYSGGTVVMEIVFDRAKPNDDKFEVRVLDKAGAELRRLVYSRQEVETTFAELHTEGKAARNPNTPAADDAKKREAVQKRLEAIEKLFPKRDEGAEKK